MNAPFRRRPVRFGGLLPHPSSRMNLPVFLRTPIVLASVAALAGCSTVSDFVGTTAGGKPIDYRSQAVKTPPLEVPPDLSQLARDGQFTVQAGAVGSVSASTFGQPGGAPVVASTGPAVSPLEVGAVRLVRDGQTRRLVTALPPEVVYQRALAFWKEAGFAIEIERPEAGVIETGWAENRAKLPQDFIRSILGRVADGLYSTGERDRFRTSIERSSQGTEITITHRGLIEGPLGDNRDRMDTPGRIGWTPRPSDPSLEAEMSYRLMSRLGAPEAQVREARATDARPAAGTPAAPSRPGAAAAAVAGVARLLPDGRIELDEGFDRAWRRLGASLDRGGFTVEDRDRAGGIYFVRFIDRSQAAETGLFKRITNIFRSDDSKSRLARYRIALKAEGASRSTVSVLNVNGQPETSPAAKQMTELLLRELR